MGDTRFGRDYGVGIGTEPLRGLCARACFVLDSANKVRHVQIMGQLNEPIDFNPVFDAMTSI